MEEELYKQIKDKGVIQMLWMGTSILFSKVISFIQIFFLNLRGFKIDYSVSLGKNVTLFQSKKQSVLIKSGSFIGDGVRIKSGFDGKIIVGKNTYIHDYSFIFAHETLRIGNNTLISPQVFITDFNHKLPHTKYRHLLSSPKAYESKRITIGENVWIGTHVVILPGVTIGDNSVIGAGSVVTKNVPRNSIVAGNPAKKIKTNEN